MGIGKGVRGHRDPDDHRASSAMEPKVLQDQRRCTNRKDCTRKQAKARIRNPSLKTGVLGASP